MPRTLPGFEGSPFFPLRPVQAQIFDFTTLPKTYQPNEESCLLHRGLTSFNLRITRIDRRITSPAGLPLSRRLLELLAPQLSALGHQRREGAALHLRILPHRRSEGTSV